MNNILIILGMWIIWFSSVLLIYLLIISIAYLSKFKAGILIRLASFWIGIHYSKSCKRWCINLIPCITLYICKQDGQIPNLKLM